jgi:hypothetical protein
MLQHFACGQGRGLDAQTVRSVVSQARSMLGLEATFCDIEIVMHGDGHELVVWYQFPPVAGSDSDSPAREAASFFIDAAALVLSPHAAA